MTPFVLKNSSIVAPLGFGEDSVIFFRKGTDRHIVFLAGFSFAGKSGCLRSVVNISVKTGRGDKNT
ncbi:MAG: hypothetical protein BA868_03440 [Desulfobacterales bacterium C00003106]|nr:MAG: hypothetical protein BA868_03440 [Desulfobacterales bacterium C00003106]